jgi:hypothetical protein
MLSRPQNGVDPMYRSFAGVACTLAMVLSDSIGMAQEANVTVPQVLAFKPRRAGTEIETPTEAEIAKCRVEAERRGKSTGWVLFGPQGQVLRRFMDTNGDDEVDEFRYFNHGMEVYRELDTNGNKKPDQYRWHALGDRCERRRPHRPLASAVA